MLIALILVAAVANLNLAVANVALPDIGKAFDASQTTLDLVAVGYSLGLAASVLYLGALGDRYGRKLMLILGTALSIPACLLAAYAPTDGVLIVARLLGGLAAGMAYPTTLALITALWSGPARTRSRSRCGRRSAAPSPRSARSSPARCSSTSGGARCSSSRCRSRSSRWCSRSSSSPPTSTRPTDPVDNLGGILSVVLVAGLVLAINFAPVPDKGTLALGLAAIALAAGVAFVIRQRRARFPLYDLDVAGRRVFWVAACAGIIVFGSLMGAMFIGQQFLQNVLGYSTLEAGAAILPAAVFMVLIAPRSAKLVEARGARFTLLIGYVFCLLGFLTMLLLWKDGISYWKVGLGYAFVGIGVGFAGTPASHSLTGSVPVQRAGMASGTADLQRDLGGAIMQSILGALLTAGLRDRLRQGDRGRAERREGHRQRAEPAHEVVRERRRRPRSSTRSTRSRSPPPRSRRSSTGQTGRTSPASSRSCSAPRSCSSSSRRGRTPGAQRSGRGLKAEKSGVADDAAARCGFRSADSYGLVLLMIVVTYVLRRERVGRERHC